MKAKFINHPNKDQIQIISETEADFEALRRWDNCVISGKFIRPSGDGRKECILHLCREV